MPRIFFFSTSTSQVLEQHDSSKLLSGVQTFEKSLALVCCAVNSKCEQGCSQVVAMNSQLDEGNDSFLLLRSRYFSIDSALLTSPCLFFLFFFPPFLIFLLPHICFSIRLVLVACLHLLTKRFCCLCCVDLVQFSTKKETRETP